MGNTEALLISVPSRLRRPHPVVVATRERLREIRPEDDGRYDPIGTAGVARLKVSRPAVNRALRFYEAVLREAERRGWSGVGIDSRNRSDRGAGVRIDEDDYLVEIHELTDKHPIPEEERARLKEARGTRFSWDREWQPPRYRHTPNGYLQVRLEQGFRGSRSVFSEGPRGPLERKLPAVFEELADRHRQRVEQREHWRRVEAERQRAWAEKRAREEREAKKTKQAELLLELAASHRRSSDLAVFLDHLEGKLAELPPERQEDLRAWCRWGRAWAGATDPLAEMQTLELPELEDL